MPLFVVPFVGTGTPEDPRRPASVQDLESWAALDLGDEALVYTDRLPGQAVALSRADARARVWLKRPDLAGKPIVLRAEEL